MLISEWAGRIKQQIPLGYEDMFLINITSELQFFSFFWNIKAAKKYFSNSLYLEK